MKTAEKRAEVGYVRNEFLERQVNAKTQSEFLTFAVILTLIRILVGAEVCVPNLWEDFSTITEC